MSTSRRPRVSALTVIPALVLSAFTVLTTVEFAQAQTADIATVTCDPVAASQLEPDVTLTSFDPQLPERIIDTRDGTGGPAEPLAAGCTLRIDMSDVGVDDASAFALSVTVISQDQGFFTAFPCAAGLPGTSSVNARPEIPTPNLVVGVPDADGMLCVFSQRGGNVIVDVSGWWSEGPNRFTPIEPTRAYDTREVEALGKLPAGATLPIDIAGELVPEDAVSVSLNIAAVAPEAKGFLVVHPCGAPAPLASNLNFVEGERRAVSAIVELGSLDEAAEGKLCVTVSVSTHVLVDVTGYDAPSAFTSPDVVIEPVADTRIVDTREAGVPGNRFGAGQTQRFDLSGVIERPDDAVAVVLNAVVVLAEEESFASITPCTPGPPTTSSLNYDLNQTANLVVTALSPDVEICVYTDTAADVVIDLVGVVTGPDGSLVNQLSLSEPDGELAPLDQFFAVDAPDATTRCDGDRDLLLRLGLAPRVTATVTVAAVNLDSAVSVVVTERDPVDVDLPITLSEDGLLTIELRRGSETAEYHVRCLPTDFPTLQVESADGAAPGWYLTNLANSAPGGGAFLAILNERGVPVWYQRLDQELIDAKLLASGDIVAAENESRFSIDETVGHRVIALDGDLVDEWLTDDPSHPPDKHDIAEIPELNDGRGIIAYPLVPDVDLTEMDLAATANAPADTRCPESVKGTDTTIVDGSIREIQGNTTSVWQWDMSDHFAVDDVRFPLCFAKYPAENMGVGEVDPFHINSIHRVVENGCNARCDYVVAARHLDAVFRVDRGMRDPDDDGPLPAAEGYVEWILSSRPTTADDPETNIKGEPRFVAPRLTVVGDPLGGPLRMHDAILDGNVLTMHDNRTGSGQPSRFVQYEIDTTGPPEGWTATLVRQIEAPFGGKSGALGSARLADDGSVLAAWGSLQPVFVEYSADGTELLRIAVPGTSPYRIVKYAPDDFDVDELRETAGNTTEAPSPRP